MARHKHIDVAAPYGAAGTVSLPGSKSISNRVLLLAALADGKTEICNLLESDGTELTSLLSQGFGMVNSLLATHQSAYPHRVKSTNILKMKLKRR